MALGCVALAPAARAQGADETIDQALCRMIESAATRHRMPVDFFTRLIWQESSFRPGVSSRAGAQGVAQFMPGTAAERGLADPFDPEQAIPKSAELLDDLRARFGNLGLAAAAYNGGPARVEAWLAGRGGLPGETRNYVSVITGRTAEDWAGDARSERPDVAEGGPPTRCLVLVAAFRRGTDRRVMEAYSGPIEESPLSPWGVQVAGNFSKAVALASYARARQRHAVTAERCRADGDRNADGLARHARVLSRAHSGGDARGRDGYLRQAAQAGRRVCGVEELIFFPSPSRGGCERSEPGEGRVIPLLATDSDARDADARTREREQRVRGSLQPTPASRSSAAARAPACRSPHGSR